MFDTDAIAAIIGLAGEGVPLPVEVVLDALCVDFVEERIASYGAGHESIPALHHGDADREP